MSAVAAVGGTYILQGRPYLEEGGGRLKAHMGNRYPLAAGQMGVARADAGEGGEGQDPWGEGRVGRGRPVHLVWVAEGPTPSQWIDNLQETEGEQSSQALGEPLTARLLQGAHLGHLAWLWRLRALERWHLLAGQLQLSLARGLEAAVVHTAVVQAAAMPVLSLALPVAADTKPLGCAPAGQMHTVWAETCARSCPGAWVCTGELGGRDTCLKEEAGDGGTCVLGG